MFKVIFLGIISIHTSSHYIGKVQFLYNMVCVKIDRTLAHKPNSSVSLAP
jgi:hypothetical protein